MSKYEPIAIGRVESLALNGKEVSSIRFNYDGPMGDNHSGRTRQLAGHDGTYLRTSKLVKGDPVMNWRTWTALSREDVVAIEMELGADIPVGCLLENIIISGIPNFSYLPPTTRLVFPQHDSCESKQAILAVWEENGPCKTVGKRLADLHDDATLTSKFVEAAYRRRGLMGFVLSGGYINEGDLVHAYSPAGAPKKQPTRVLT